MGDFILSPDQRCSYNPAGQDFIRVGDPALGYSPEKSTPPTPPFTPATPGNLVLWVEADSLGLANNDPVASWLDQSTLHNDFAQATAGQRPLFKTAGGPNGLPFVLGDGVDDSLLTADTASLKLIGNSQTLVLIFNTTASDGWAFTHYDAGVSNGWACRLLPFYNVLCDKVTQGAAQFEGEKYTINDGVWHMAVWTMSNGYATIMIDGLPDKSFPIDQPFNGADPSSFLLDIVTSAVGAQLFNLGSNLAPAACGIYGALAYAKALTNVEAKQLFDYYNAKAGTGSGADSKPYLQFNGDSLVQGIGTTAGMSMPDQVVAMLGGTPVYDFDNNGVVGFTIAQINADATWRDWQYCLAHGDPKQVMFMDGASNDLANGNTPADTFTAIKAYFAGFKAMFPGVPSVVMTVAPRTSIGISPTFEVDRQTYNALVRGQTAGVYWDGVADVGNSPTIGQPGDQLNLTYYSTDTTHWNNAGAGVAAAIVAAAIQAIL